MADQSGFCRLFGR